MPAVACFAGAHCSLSVTAYVRVLVEQDGTRYGMGRMGEEYLVSLQLSIRSIWLAPTASRLLCIVDVWPHPLGVGPD